MKLMARTNPIQRRVKTKTRYRMRVDSSEITRLVVWSKEDDQDRYLRQPATSPVQQKRSMLALTGDAVKGQHTLLHFVACKARIAQAIRSAETMQKKTDRQEQAQRESKLQKVHYLHFDPLSRWRYGQQVVVKLTSARKRGD